MPLTHRSRAAFAAEVARSAGALANRYFHGEIAFAVEEKDGPQDFVSAADRVVEAHIRTALANAFPDDSMLGEEGGGAVDNRVWVVDPIDGTLNFVHGMRYRCVSLCYIEDGVRTVGATYDPSLDELFLAERGRGATLNGKPIRGSNCASIAQALIAQGYVHRHALDAHLAVRRAMLSSGAAVKDPGAGALMLAHVAAGRFDAFYEPHMHPWDASAGLLLVEEAGGKVLSYPGRNALAEGGPVLASAPAIFGVLEALVREGGT
jgi:myo-inositol-1(or 4)-monophosphatase